MHIHAHPCTSKAAGIEMALPGDCPVKQSSTVDLVQDKRAGKKTINEWNNTLQNDHSTATLLHTAVTCMFVPIYIIQFFFSPPVPKMGSPCGVQVLTIDHSITNAATQKFVKGKTPETNQARVETMNLEGQSFALPVRRAELTDQTSEPLASTSLMGMLYASV